jgi:type I restriction enzyme S subunit
MKQGWEIKKLGEVCDFQNGFAFKSNTYKETGLPILRITNIQNQSLEINDLVYFDAKDYKENFDRFKVFKDDLVVAMSGATTGKLGINTTDTVFYLNQRVGKFIPKKVLLKPYLYYFLSTKVEESLRIAAGAAQPNLSTEQINNFEIPLPPFSEQQRIVAILDEAFAAISKAKANAEQNLKNAKELFESYLQGVFENKGGGWESKELMKVCEQITDGSHFSPKSSSEDEYPYITVRDIEDDIIDFDNCKFICKNDYQSLLKNGCKPNSGDLLFSKDGTVGKVSLVDFEKEFVVLSSLAIIRPNAKIITSSLLKYILKNPQFLQTAIGMKTGVAIRRIILKNLKLIEINFPKSLQEQQIIVQKLDALSAETKKLEAIYKQKINDLEELKKSVLQKAFSGEL